MKVVMSGASGFVGQYLTQHFKSQGYEVSPINRKVLQDESKLQELIDSAAIIVNLAGASIIARWSDSYKKLLMDSRVDTTKAIVKAMNKSSKEQTLISTSAVGVYSNGYLKEICEAWENEAQQCSKRVVIFRFGVVIGKNGGALEKMLLPFKLGLGGTIGDGSQPFTYIHIEDLASAYDFMITNNKLSGTYDLVAPELITNRAMTKALAAALHRPAIFPIPTFVFKILYGEGAQVLTEGQIVSPKKLLESGFEF